MALESGAKKEQSDERMENVRMATRGEEEKNKREEGK